MVDDVTEATMARTSDNVDELVRDGGLATTVVLQRQTVDHVTSVLRRVVHGVATM